MNIAMWGRALRTIPRISKDEWDGLDLVSKWLIASRAGVLFLLGLIGDVALRGLLAMLAR